MKNKLIYTIYQILLITSCSKEIPFSEVNFRSDEMTTEISVNGFISNEKAPCRIILMEPVSVSEIIMAVPIHDAIILLKHQNNTFHFQYDTLGIYCSIDSITGVAKETYTLEINWHGKKYTAEEIMPEAPDDEFFLRFDFKPSKDINGNHIPFEENIGMTTVEAHTFGYSKTNLWGFVETGYGNDTIPNVGLFQLGTLGIYTHQSTITQGMFPRVSGSFQLSHANTEPFDSIEIIKAEISESYIDYLLDVFNETDWQGGMFSAIPGNVRSNLSEGATGYFYALNVKRKRFLVKDLVNLN